MELEPYGIRVISIEPGFFQTPIATKGWRSTSGDSPYQQLVDAIVSFVEGGVSTGGDPEEIADAIVDAASEPYGPVHVLVGESAHWFYNEGQTRTEAEMASLYRELLGLVSPVGQVDPFRVHRRSRSSDELQCPGSLDPSPSGIASTNPGAGVMSACRR